MDAEPNVRNYRIRIPTGEEPRGFYKGEMTGIWRCLQQSNTHTCNNPKPAASVYPSFHDRISPSHMEIKQASHADRPELH